MSEKAKSNLTAFLILSQSILMPAFLLCMILVLPNFDLHGFGVDSHGKVYIGKREEVQCYHNSELLYSIPIQPYKAYSMTIQSDNTLLITAPEAFDIYDLQGNRLPSPEEYDSSLYNTLLYRQKLQTPDGSEYRCVNILGFRKIFNSNDEIVYQTPVTDYLLLILTWFVFILTFVSIFIMVMMYLVEPSLKKS